jgi:hypothetical protein
MDSDPARSARKSFLGGRPQQVPQSQQNHRQNRNIPKQRNVAATEQRSGQSEARSRGNQQEQDNRQNARQAPQLVNSNREKDVKRAKR